jgi:hypothetical protein
MTKACFVGYACKLIDRDHGKPSLAASTISRRAR